MNDEPRDSRSGQRGTAWVAVGVWVLTAPAAILVPYYARLNPFQSRASGLAIGAALLTIGVGVAAVLRWPRPLWPGIAAGLLASWTLLTQRLALSGTPFGFAGLQADAGRINAMATRYLVTWAPSDAWIPGIPSEYPPLYFMVIGRLSALLDLPAWRVLPYAAAVILSGTVLVAFLLWRKLFPDWVALAIAAVAVIAFLDPRKPYETLTLAIMIPWAVLAFGRPPKGRMHWLPAGLLGAVIATTYQAWLVFGVLGVAVIAVIAWRNSDDRRGYLRHVGLVALTAFVGSSWYVLPYQWALFTDGGPVVSDRYIFASLHQGFLPFLEPTLLGALELVGLLGLIWFRRTVWWATPLLALALGTLAFRVLGVIRFVATGHTSFMQYSAQMVVAVLSAAGVAVLWHAAVRIRDEVSLTAPKGFAAAAVALLLAWSTYTVGLGWMPSGGGPQSSYAAQAHLEPLPDGRYPIHAPADNRTAWFPVGPIESAVESVLGADPSRVSLSDDERLYAIAPWPGYTSVSRSASGALTHWDARAAEIARLAGTRDRAAFTAASAATRFGPIDIFVLSKDGDDWMWRTTRFSPDQFDPTAWAVFDALPNDTVLVVRRP